MSDDFVNPPRKLYKTLMESSWNIYNLYACLYDYELNLNYRRILIFQVSKRGEEVTDNEKGARS